MIEKLLEKFGCDIYLSKFKKLERAIGCKLIFHKIPDHYINGCVRWDMTETWKRSRLKIERGANYFTMGRIENGSSSRFDKNAPEYQSWLGGYTVRITSKQEWTIKDHFKLAIADQNSWLKLYGDPSPMTSDEGWKFTTVDEMEISGYSGMLYEGGCTTHSDVGSGHHTMKLRLICDWMATIFNLSNPKLKLRGESLRPKTADGSYETVALRGYIAIFNIGENSKAILYANGTTDTFLTLKEDLLDAMRAIEIIKVS
jgi:hypothetical protein